MEIKTTVKKTENEKSKKQEAELAKAKKAKEEAAKAAKQEQEKAKEEKKAAKTAKETKKKEEESRLNSKEELMNLAGKALSSKKSLGFFPGILIGVVIGFLLASVIGLNPFSITDTVETAKEDADALIDETFFGYTAADFKDAILGKASEEQQLIVMEQPLQIETTIIKAGLGGLSIFSKTKNVTYAATGEFTVDLSLVNENSIEVDEENKVVTLTIPHAALHSIVIDYENTQFEDTEKGILSFGDLALTLEDQNELEKSVNSEMNKRLNQSDVLSLADEYATISTWKVFQPFVTAISKEYTLEVVFDK